MTAHVKAPIGSLALRLLVGAVTCLTISLGAASVLLRNRPRTSRSLSTRTARTRSALRSITRAPAVCPHPTSCGFRHPLKKRSNETPTSGPSSSPWVVAITRAGLQDRLLYLVLTKGVPLRIIGATGLSGTLASVDSELTLLYRRLVGQPVPLEGKIENPYYLGNRDLGEARPFSHREHDIYLVTRIDAFTVDQALALIDRAQAPGTDGRIVLDQRGGAGNGDQWLEQAASRLADLGHQSRVVLETTARPARDEKAVLGYSSWGASDPANRVRSVGMGFTPGSIAANLASFDARTFRQPPDDWRPTSSSDKATWFEGSGDALIGDLIRDGVTGVSGQVGEAYLLGAVRPEILFPAYLAGYNLAEAFYLAVPTLSWQTVVVGDPLCAPFRSKDSHSSRAGGRNRSGDDAARVICQAAPGGVSFCPSRRPRRWRYRSSSGLRRYWRATIWQVPGERWKKRWGWRHERSTSWSRWRNSRSRPARTRPRSNAYRRILEMQPANVVALNNLAYALAVRRNAPAEALPLARRAVSLAPRAGSVIDTLAWVEHLLGNHAVAAKLSQQAVQLEPRQADIRLHAATVYLAVGQKAQAEAELNEALRLDPALGARDDVRQLRERIAALKPPRPQ